MTVGTVLLGLAALGIVAELAARAHLRSTAYFVWPRFYRRVIELDRETFPQMPSTCWFHGNGDGERGAECPRGPGVHRVLLLGGSTVESSMNDQPQSWPAQAEALLNRPEALAALGAARVHVGNVGRSGMDVPGCGFVLERTLPRYPGLAAVWMMIGPGDLMRWLEAGAPVDSEVPPLDVHRCFGENPEVEFGLHPKRWAITTVLKRLRLTVIRPVERRDKAGRWMLKARQLRRNAERFITEVPDTTKFLARFEQDLDAAVRRACAGAREVVLVRQPVFRKDRYTPEEEALLWNGGIGNAYRGAEVKVFYSTEVILAVLDRIEEIVRRVAVRHGALFVETRGRVTPGTESFYDHFHLTPHGAEQLGRCVAEAVVAARRR